MKSNIKIISTIPLVFLILGGFFYFLGNNKEKIVVESNNSIKADVLEKENIASESSIDNKVKEIPIDEKSEEEVLKDNDVQVIKEAPNEDRKQENELVIKNRLVSWGFEKVKNRKIDTIILHTSYNILGGDQYDLEKVLKEYEDYQVAPHYVIDRKGFIYQLVEDKNIAYHAGESKVPDGRNGVNDFSLGIEILNSEKDIFTDAQYEAINDLVSFLKGKNNIIYILGHNEIAPSRKTDPWNINWSKINK